MRQTYFGLNTHDYRLLEDDLSRYSLITRQLFDRSLPSERKAELQSDRDRMHDDIQNKLLEVGTILGFLTLDQVELLENTFDGIGGDKVRRLLGANCIPNEALEMIIEALTKSDVAQTPANLIFFLEKAKQKNQSIVVWIM